MRIQKKRPKTWLSNAIEKQLETIQIQLEEFKKNPNYINKEKLISTINSYDIDQSINEGWNRTTNYEGYIVSSLYYDAMDMEFIELKNYLYKWFEAKMRLKKTIPNPQALFSKFIFLFQYYYFSYKSFCIKKDSSYADCLIKLTKNFISYDLEADLDIEERRKMHLNFIVTIYVFLIYDISHVKSPFIFSKDEISDLFKLVATCIDADHDIFFDVHLRKMLVLSLLNHVFKLRVYCDEGPLCKYVSSDIAQKEIENKEIWLSRCPNLKDEVNQNVASELFEKDYFKDYKWTENIKCSPGENNYITSFYKSFDDPTMYEKYGEYMYEYKSDLLPEMFAPLRKAARVEDHSPIPLFSRVMSFDVLYNREDAIKEMDFICSVIDNFDISNDQKKDFLNEILHYWMFSIKDESFEHEHERRYVVIMEDDCKYYDINTDDSDFLKLKTGLFERADVVRKSYNN
jgi:hypothetical protein